MMMHYYIVFLIILIKMSFLKLNLLDNHTAISACLGYIRNICVHPISFKCYAYLSIFTLFVFFMLL